MGGVIVISADTTALIGVVGVIFNSCTAGIDNSLIVESKEKNIKI